MLGGLIVTTLVVIMLFGPRLAPYSPNTTQQIAIIDGEIQVPPFAPSNLHPWGTDPLGRDMLSLVLAGAQQTLILAFIVVFARLTIGFILGVIGGWFRDSWLDRLIMGTVQALAVFPTLLLAALLIFAFNIQAGMRTFIIALSIVGWTEVMQLIRSEVIKIRPQPFIESAVAVGQRTSRLILFHVLPNLAPALIAVAAVEVGAVLLILGELGFIGIFINGGAGSGAAAFGLFSNVPEWGSLLSNIRGWTRSYPWTGFYPMAAFFIAILGFNMLSEGLRRLVEEVGLVINRLFNRYTLVAGVVIVAFFVWARTNTGSIVDYRLQANTFTREGAVTQLEALTVPELQGRSLGSEGMQKTADYIRNQFQQVGLQAGGESLTYYQQDTRTYFAFDDVPVLELDDGAAALEFGQDFAVFPTVSRNEGMVNGRVRFLALGPEKLVSDLDYSEDIVLLFDQANLTRLAEMSCRGVLIIAPDLSEMKRRYTYSTADPGTGCGENTPVLWVSDRVANRLLQGNGFTVQQLSELVEDMVADEWLDMPTEITADMQITGHSETVPINNVIGHLPGRLDALDGNLILVAVQYDAPPAPLGEPYPAVNDNASGVAVMLEAIRTMQESGYQPYKTFLFVAYSGEGLPDQTSAPDPRSFLAARNGFDNFNIEAVIYLRGFAGGGEEMGIWGEETTRLAKLLETASHLVNQRTVRLDGSPTMNIFVPGLRTTAVDPEIPQVGFSRRGWERNARLSGDSMTFISTENMENSGRALSLGLMILGRERNY
jgi:peptide/nickel transport system permease protein